MQPVLFAKPFAGKATIASSMTASAARLVSGVL